MIENKNFHITLSKSANSENEVLEILASLHLGMEKNAFANKEISLMTAAILIAFGLPTSYALRHAKIKAEDLASRPELSQKAKAIVESDSPEIQEKVQQIVEQAEVDFPMTITNKVPNSVSPEVEKESPDVHQSCEITPQMVQAIIDLEYDPKKETSSQGAVGRMQIMKPTWDEINEKNFGGKYPFETYAKIPKINIKFGTLYLQNIKKYLDSHKSEWKTDELPLIFACYFGGIGNIRKHKFDPELIKSLPKTYDYMQRGSNLMGYQGTL
jgi:hypothetical protein